MDTPGQPSTASPQPQISIAVGVVVALLASFVQSLGLTIQRKSHLQNESAPAASRRRDWQRPLWLAGFTIFITSNVLGSVFQIGALPIVVLAPLGAVSLLWNAFFARILLGDIFSRYLILGTILIAGGAVLIAIFGVVPETTHTLQELLALYTRPSFVVWIALQFAVLASVLALAHWSEAKLERGLQDIYISLPTADFEDGAYDLESASAAIVGRSTLASRSGIRRKRRWSTPPAYTGAAATVFSSSGSSNGDIDKASPGTGPHPLERADSNRIQTLAALVKSNPGNNALDKPTPRHVSFGTDIFHSPTNKHISRTVSALESKYKSALGAATGSSSVRPKLPHDRVERMRLWLGIAYGSASGTLSGLCLLFAKTGVELLILTVVGNNQFKRWESWMIVLALLICALLQLWYLNKSLRLVGPTLICPLAFCFYNLSSIFNGLMYYDQWSLLSGLQDGLMCLGIAILLAGVWIVSIKSADPDAEQEADMILRPGELASEHARLGHFDQDVVASDESEAEEGGVLLQDADGHSFDEEIEEEEDEEEAEASHRRPSEVHEETFGDLKSRIAQLYHAFLLDQDGPPRGFSVGISASSPGFAIRPRHMLHQRRNTSAALSSLPRLSISHSHNRSDDYHSPTSDPLAVSPTSMDDTTRRQHGANDDSNGLMRRSSSHNPTDSPRRQRQRPVHPDRTASEGGGHTETGGANDALASSIVLRDRDRDPTLSYRHRRKRSLAGDIYVGASDPFSEEPALESPLSPLGPHHHHRSTGRVRRSSSLTNSPNQRRRSSALPSPGGALGSPPTEAASPRSRAVSDANHNLQTGTRTTSVTESTPLVQTRSQPTPASHSHAMRTSQQDDSDSPSFGKSREDSRQGTTWSNNGSSSTTIPAATGGLGRLLPWTAKRSKSDV